MQFLKRNIIYIILFLIIVNLGLLNYWHYQPSAVAPGPLSDLTPISSKPIGGFPEVQLLDAELIEEEMKQSTAALTLKVDDLSNKLDNFMDKTPATQAQSNQISGGAVKEYYIPLGSGSTTSKAWIDLTGVEAY